VPVRGVVPPSPKKTDDMKDGNIMLFSRVEEHC
jgi:hypothetical protein